jgi:2-polyprenyl-3-methyl-5-hydroxy-6-metoxy-1,4-benzoquinol methylase
MRDAPSLVPSSSLHRFLSLPRLYIRWQHICAADRLRLICLNQFLKLREGERVLDIGCGPGYILHYMPKVHYVGFDIEPRYIRYAKKHYGDRGQFFCERFTGAHVTRFAPFNAIMLLGIIHHLADPEVEDLLGLVTKCLDPNGRVVTLDPCFTPGQSRISRWIAQADRGGFVRDEQGYRRLASREFVSVEATLVRNVCRIPSTELIMHLREPLVGDGGQLARPTRSSV